MSTPQAQAPDQDAAQDPQRPQDPYHGVGGVYVLDPSTGKRTPQAPLPQSTNPIPSTKPRKE